ncbi:branched-chain amino acid transport system ATP-binding protein [Rhizobium petrolearium]|uniref:ABC transporter ATP-binding protein n=1 Tax=Neorhizobium phenanthreniclasticum TaxID=3157917 RepID=A0ABV0MD89_9HYPH|nr:ABC transporter ATP-binding protein [Neorhizobium petrolearium]MBP1848514.1 branched-chain amino acid transport system ATP-binding protein [Neorhizobium petrolearium]MCC2614521.1 ABC transporter ATP-binding protein [Neorhizobium petrolearium]
MTAITRINAVKDQTAILSARNLKAWYGESQALHGIDLDIHSGETVALLGRNGAGKTTTLKSITGLMDRRSGEIKIGGKDISRLPLHHIARHGLGFVPEERGIFSGLTVQENLLLPPIVAEGGHTVEEIYALFPNLKERRHSQGTSLSGGEQQMLAIARILRTGIRILLLDEPTEGLAPVIVDRIGDVIIALRKRGITIILVEQNFRFAQRVAERYYVIEHGQVLDQFSAAELPGRQDWLSDVLGV